MKTCHFCQCFLHNIYTPTHSYGEFIPRMILPGRSCVWRGGWRAGGVCLPVIREASEAAHCIEQRHDNAMLFGPRCWGVDHMEISVGDLPCSSWYSWGEYGTGRVPGSTLILWDSNWSPVSYMPRRLFVQTQGISAMPFVLKMHHRVQNQGCCKSECGEPSPRSASIYKSTTHSQKLAIPREKSFWQGLFAKKFRD